MLEQNWSSLVGTAIAETGLSFGLFACGCSQASSDVYAWLSTPGGFRKVELSLDFFQDEETIRVEVIRQLRGLS